MEQPTEKAEGSEPKKKKKLECDIIIEHYQSNGVVDSVKHDTVF